MIPSSRDMSRPCASAAISPSPAEQLVLTAQRLNPIAQTLLAYREIAKNLLLMCFRTTRNASSVQEEYDGGRWKKNLDHEPWLRTASLFDYLKTNDTTLRIAKICDEFVRIPTDRYYEFRVRMLASVVSQFAGKDDGIVELGCGNGMNLFSLYTQGFRCLQGFDISANAITAAQKTSRHFGLEKELSFGSIDLTDNKHENFKLITERVVMTCYALEQLKDATPVVIENIARMRPKRVIHVEPTIEELALSRPKDLANYLYIKRKDYQDNLLTTIRGFERRGVLRLIKVERLYCAPSIRHDPTVVCWEPSTSA